MTELKIGDVVWLKSGSPALTVDDIRKDGGIGVQWFNTSGTIEYAVFHPAMLRLTDPA